MCPTSADPAARSMGVASGGYRDPIRAAESRMPSDDVESVVPSAARNPDRRDATPFQVGVLFF
jgi:hypothetical protein